MPIACKQSTPFKAGYAPARGRQQIASARVIFLGLEIGDKTQTLSLLLDYIVVRENFAVG